jgi:hypothetical protein
VEDGKAVKRKFKTYPIGYFHIDIAEVRTAMGRLYLFVVVDRTSKFAFTELHESAHKAPLSCTLDRPKCYGRDKEPGKERITRAPIPQHC